MASSKIRMGASFSKALSDSQPLALAAGQALPAITDHCLVALGHTDDEIMSQSRLGRRDDFVVRHVWATITEIVPNGIVEENRFLGDDGHLFAQRAKGHFRKIVAVDSDRT